MKVHISLENLPTFETSPVFCCLDDDVERDLQRFVNVFERASVALRFLQNEGASGDYLHVRKEEEEQMQAAYLRASLMEFVGMEDSLPTDLRSLGINKPALRIWDTNNAMLILLRELRHIHIHVGRTRFLRRDKAVVFRGFGKELETNVVICTIPKQDLGQLTTGRRAKNFKKHELQAAIEWLDNSQSNWGIHDVVLTAVNTYARLITTQYANDAT